MDFGPFVRIALRYGIGYVVGSETGEMLSMDDELVNAIAIGIGVMVEGFYQFAKKRGWAT